MDHFGAGIGLLVVGGDGDGVKFTDAVIALQDAGRVFPGDRRAGFHLGPGNFAARATAGAALGDEVVDATFAVRVTGIPVLHGGVFDLRIIEGDQFHHGGVELVFIALRCGAAFEVGDIGTDFGDDQRAFKLPGVAGVDAEIGGEFHRAAHALGDVDEAAIGEDGGIQRGEVIVSRRDDAAEILADEVWMGLHRFTDRAENYPRFGQRFPEGGGNRHTVEHRIDSDRRAFFFRAFNAGEDGAFAQRDAELFVGAQQFGVHLVQAFRAGLLFRGGVVVQVLIVDWRVVDLGPVRFLGLQPGGVGFQPPVEQPLRLVLTGRDQPDDVFVQALGGHVHFDIGRKAPFIAAIGDGLDSFEGFGDGDHVRGLYSAGKVERAGSGSGTRKAKGTEAARIWASEMPESAP